MGHYNPENRDIRDSNYASECSSNIQLCEAGDLAGKHGTISITGKFTNIEYGDLFCIGELFV